VRSRFLLLALLAPLTANACPADTARPIASLGELPKEVLNLLGRFETPRPAIADIGENFNATDVILPDSPPRRRLVAGVASADCIELKIEFGGIGYYTEQVEFQKTWRGWAKTKGGYDSPIVKPAPALAPRPGQGSA
jgi:hypothetical protein